MRYTTRIIVPPKVRRSGPPGSGGAHRPQVLGVRKSFGFDDPFGVATAGHVEAASRHPDFAPLFVQYPFGGTAKAALSPVEAITTATRAVGAARSRVPWGADANLLRTPSDIEGAAAAGFTHFTLDPTAFVRSDVGSLDTGAVERAVRAQIEEGVLTEDWHAPYLDRTIDLPGSDTLTLTLEPLQRAAARYGRAVRHCARLSEAAARACQGRLFEMEAYFGAAPYPTSAIDHLFIGLELEARGVRLTGLALNLLEAGDSARAESAESRLRQHAAVAGFCGPYKLVFHGLSLQPALLPLLGRSCGDGLHFKSGYLSYLEALRVLARTNPALYDQVVQLHFTTEEPGPTQDRRAILDDVVGSSSRTDVVGAEITLGSNAAALFSTTNPASISLRDAFRATLEEHADIYREQLIATFDTTLSLLKADL